jgi:hypothetical protein
MPSILLSLIFVKLGGALVQPPLDLGKLALKISDDLLRIG